MSWGSQVFIILYACQSVGVQPVLQLSCVDELDTREPNYDTTMTQRKDNPKKVNF